ncbi:MAG: ATP-dependent DNA helicase RecG, partial [Acidobacteria bacterium]|nr:ATP-dependent DNA helicase RecG [Acidobacteriota bacterium]
ALDGDASQVSLPKLPPLSTHVDSSLVQAAVAFLRRTSLPIEPRKSWPSGGLPHYGVRGRIAAEHQSQPGKALCVWGDAGWGGLVKQGKYRDGRFADELVTACVELLQAWNPQPSPASVTCVPSLRHPDLVPDFARRLAVALGLPFHPVLLKTADRPEQKTMVNSAQQARNLDGALAVSENPLPNGPVLLVDDMVDSRWTFTATAWLLHSQGSGVVWPLALAQTGHDQ